MSAVWNNEGVIRVWDQLLNWTAWGLEGYLRLFTNNFTPGITDVVGDYTECALAGYAAFNTNGTTWTINAAAGIATASQPLHVYNFTPYGGGTSIYGYYLTNHANTKVYYAERFAVPYAVPIGGGSLGVLPVLTCRKLPP